MTKFEKFAKLLDYADVVEVDHDYSLNGYIVFGDDEGFNLQFGLDGETNDVDITKEEIEDAVEISPSKFEILVGKKKIPYIVAFYEKSPYILPND